MYLWSGLETGLSYIHRSIRAVSDAEQREASIKADPEDDVAEHLVTLDSRDATHSNQRDLDELHDEEVHPGLKRV